MRDESSLVVGKEFSYTLGQIRTLIGCITDRAKGNTMVVPAKAREVLKLVWDPEAGGVITYASGEEVMVPIGTRKTKLIFIIPEDKLIRNICMPAILRKNNVKEKNFSDYTFERIKRAPEKPKNENDFYLSFTIIKKR